MDWFITVGLMWAILTFGIMFSAFNSGFFYQDATEPFLSHQKLEMGITFGLAAIPPLMRGHNYIGWIALALSALSFMSGAISLRKFNKKEHAAMLARRAEEQAMNEEGKTVL